jgi:hypothetical protein
MMGAIGRVPAGRLALSVVLVGLGAALTPGVAEAQYFGRNKVQYEDFEWRVLHTDQFNFHFYPEEQEAVADAARMGQRWYTRLSRVFNHEFDEVKPIILYANHPDFQQTNTTASQVSEGTGGFTESMKNRVVMPLTGTRTTFWATSWCTRSSTTSRRRWPPWGGRDSADSRCG